jgi:two-component system, chemotaxis family, protein-glutamate methylesterase/glutaminase
LVVRACGKVGQIATNGAVHHEDEAHVPVMTDSHQPWFVAIGASGSDGLHDISALLRTFPASLPAVVLVVLHRLWDHPSRLCAILQRSSKLPIVVAAQGDRLRPGTVYVGEPAAHLTLAEKSFGAIVIDPEARYRNRTVDLLFHSVAAHAGPRGIGVVLSGSLDDGSRGLAAIHHAGGLSMVITSGQRPRRGMPENASNYDGPIDVEGTAADIGRAVIARTAVGPRIARGRSAVSSL